MQLKKGSLNFAFGLLNKLIVIALGMLVPKLLIERLGSEMNGFLSTVNQVYGYVTIIEAGIGFATTQALYAPLARGSKDSMNGILSATHSYYKKVGLIYLGLVSAISALFPLMGNPALPAAEIGALVFLIGLTGGISFFFQGKFLLLLEADGKSYIIQNVSTINTIVSGSIKIVFIQMKMNLILAYALILILQILVAAFYSFYRKKNYRWINFHSEPDFKAVEKKNSVFIHRVCWFVFSNTDIILISSCYNYALSSVYSIYSLIASTVYQLISLIWTSIVFYWGKLYNEDRDKFRKLNQDFQDLFYIVTFWGNTMLYLLCIPFIKLYLSGAELEAYVDGRMLSLFVAVYVLQAVKIPSISLIEIAGYFKETQRQALIEIVLNMGGSLLLMQNYGVYGILAGTILALIYRDIVTIKYSMKHILKSGQKTIYMHLFFNALLMQTAIFIGKPFALRIHSWGSLLIYTVVIMFLSSAVFLIGNFDRIRKSIYTFKA